MKIKISVSSIPSHIITKYLMVIYNSSSNTLLLQTCTSSFYVLRHTIYLTLAVAIQSSSFMVASSLNMCSVELPGGGGELVFMNNVILAKWRIALSINIKVLGNR